MNVKENATRISFKFIKQTRSPRFIISFRRCPNSFLIKVRVRETYKTMNEPLRIRLAKRNN